MAPRMAIVRAGEMSPLTDSHVSVGTFASSPVGLIWKRSPMVSTCMPKCSVITIPAIVITMMAMSEPGIFLEISGVQAIITTESTPTMVVARSMEEKFSMYTPHLEMKSAGTPPSMVSPKMSFICVVKMVSAIPLVKPTTMG